jgi:hypothetical protein
MLKGFSVPLTPQGKSALATLPPWHYSSDCIAIEYWTDRETIAALLPSGLSLDEKSEGRAFFWFLDWQFTGSNDELTDPARYQYREAFVSGAPLRPISSTAQTTRFGLRTSPRCCMSSSSASTRPRLALVSRPSRTRNRARFRACRRMGRRLSSRCPRSRYSTVTAS